MQNSTLQKTVFLFLFCAFLSSGKLFAQLPSLTVTITNSTNCSAPCDGTASVPTVAGATYLWSDGQTTATATGLCAGTYSVNATVSIYSTSGVGTVWCGTGVVDLTTASGLSLFPSPATESVSLDLSSTSYGDYSLSVITILGETIRTEKISVNGNLNKQIDVSALPGGVYFVELRNGNKFYAVKFLKQ